MTATKSPKAELKSYEQEYTCASKKCGHVRIGLRAKIGTCPMCGSNIIKVKKG